MSTETAVFTVAEFCEAHRISRAFFYLLRKRGEAPKCFKVGRRRLISREAAAEWREEKTQQSATV